MKIIKGNIVEATEPIIIHQVNCQNAMGSGVAKALYERWSEVKREYHDYCVTMAEFGLSKEELLGQICPVEVDGKTIINCFSQLTYGNDGRQHTDYNAVEECFNKIVLNFPYGTIAIPYLYGCGLGGGDWEIVSEIIEDSFGSRAVIYKL